MTTAGAAAFIAAGTHATLNATLFSWRPVVYIGLISYSLYLWHWPLLSFLRILHLEDVMLDRSLRVAAVGFSVLAAIAVFHLVEVPLRRRDDLGRLGIILCAGLIVAAAAGAVLVAARGLPGRTPLETNPFAWPLSWRTDDRCLDQYWRREDMRDEFFCVRNDYQHAPSTVVLGDSHANALWPGIEAQHAGFVRIADRWVSTAPIFEGRSSGEKTGPSGATSVAS